MDVDVVEEVVTEKRVHIADAVVELRRLLGFASIDRFMAKSADRYGGGVCTRWAPLAAETEYQLP